MSATATTTAKTSPSNVNNGDIMSFTYWGKVTECVTGFQGTKITCKDIDRGLEFVVDGNSLIENSSSSSQFSTTEKVTKSQIVEILVNSHNVPFTVRFVKQDGTLRNLVGRLIGVDKKNLGYVDVEDLEKPVGSRFRLVDCRTIKSLIVNNVKYYV